MKFRLIDSRWDELFDDALRLERRADRLRIVCPFIKAGAASRLVQRAPYNRIQIITRFNQDDFCAGVGERKGRISKRALAKVSSLTQIEVRV